MTLLKEPSLTFHLQRGSVCCPLYGFVPLSPPEAYGSVSVETCFPLSFFNLLPFTGSYCTLNVSYVPRQIDFVTDELNWVAGTLMQRPSWPTAGHQNWTNVEALGVYSD
jgi:hypothetical protein